MKRVEILSLLLVAALMLLNVYLVPYTAPLIVISISTLATFYFLNGFAALETEGLKGLYKALFNQFQKKLPLTIGRGAGIGLSMVLVGVLYQFQKWPLGDMIMYAGLIVLMIVAVLLAVKNQPVDNRRLIQTRILVIGLAALLLSVFSDDIFAFKYREYPSSLKRLNVRRPTL